MTRVTRAIKLDRKVRLRAVEIDDPIADRLLSPELQIGKLSVTEPGPKSLFCRGR